MRVYALVKIFVNTTSRTDSTSTTVGHQVLFPASSIASAIHCMRLKHAEQHSVSYRCRTGKWVQRTLDALLEESATYSDDRFGEDEVQIVWRHNRGRVLYCFGAADLGAARDCTVPGSVQDTLHEFASVRISINIRCVLGTHNLPARFGQVVQLHKTSMLRALQCFCQQAGPGFELADYDVQYQNAKGEYVRLSGAARSDCQEYCVGADAVRLRLVPAAQTEPDFGQLLHALLGGEPGVDAARVPEPRVPRVFVFCH